ncbi:MAG: NAD(P)-binding protein [Bacilli bacterium]|nr:NAD(P)-binding protein [Bacilli bacterium]
MIRLRQIKVLVGKNNLKEEISKKLKINISDILNIKIIKKSIDARFKPQLYYVYEVDIQVTREDIILKKISSNDIFKAPIEEYYFQANGKLQLNNRPVIVGSGPAGLFCAYMLSEYGYKPLIIERGSDVDTRIEKVKRFWKDNILDTECNVQFGEGGAGTFSDGKLNTLIKDKDFRMKKVFEIFVENGAPSDIMYENKPHIGTDILVDVVRNMRKKIIANGGEMRFNTKLTDINCCDNKITGVVVNDEEKIGCNCLILAIGHSARDTFKMLYDKKIIMQPKPFAIGVRIQHPQSLINHNQYGIDDVNLPSASYKLTHTCQNGRGVYTFCMCPGGYVVNSSSENQMLAINGMSYHARDSKIANSAVIVTVNPNDFGNHPLDGMKWQQELEKRTYQVGNGLIPVQLFKDFINNKPSEKLGSIKPMFKGNYKLSNLNMIFPNYINESLKEGIIAMDKKIKGFASDDAILAAIESRTSSPIRIVRDDNYEASVKGIYPIGEGAGYAGGITSSAMDGIKIAEAIMSKYNNE